MGFLRTLGGSCIGKEYRKKRFGATPSRCVPGYSGHRRAMGLCGNSTFAAAGTSGFEFTRAAAPATSTEPGYLRTQLKP